LSKPLRGSLANPSYSCIKLGRYVEERLYNREGEFDPQGAAAEAADPVAAENARIVEEAHAAEQQRIAQETAEREAREAQEREAAAADERERAAEVERIEREQQENQDAMDITDEYI
jgi:hypothetical protein